MNVTIPKSQSLTQANFRHFIRSRPMVIVHFSYTGTFSMAVREYFSAEYGTEIAFGHINSSRILYPGWAKKYVGPALPPTQRLWNHVPNGYYLFINGQAVGHHSGHGSDPTDGYVSLAVGLFGLAINSKVLQDAALTNHDRNQARRVTTYFESIIAKHGRPLPDSDWSELFAKVTSEDPYVILGVPRNAADVEVKAVYRKQMKENHPDKVSHMSNEIRRTAERETRKIQEAYTVIMAKRRQA